MKLISFKNYGFQTVEHIVQLSYPYSARLSMRYTTYFKMFHFLFISVSCFLNLIFFFCETELITLTLELIIKRYLQDFIHSSIFKGVTEFTIQGKVLISALEMKMRLSGVRMDALSYTNIEILLIKKTMGV